jgi:hypothetical protein
MANVVAPASTTVISTFLFMFMGAWFAGRR